MNKIELKPGECVKFECKYALGQYVEEHYSTDTWIHARPTTYKRIAEGCRFLKRSTISSRLYVGTEPYSPDPIATIHKTPYKTKAQQYVESLEVVFGPSMPDTPSLRSGDGLIACVTMGGNLAVSKLRFTTKEALQLADWIKDTFS